jgi:cytochrome c oxidase assembly protein Cox11
MVQMPVTFYVDQSIIKDRNTVDVKSITLSYTFFASDDQSEAEKLQTTQIITDEKDTIISREVVPKG